MQLLSSFFRTRMGQSKYKRMQTGGGRLCHWECSHMNFFLIKYLFYKLLATITRFFVGFVKMLALFKISVIRNSISFFRLVQKIDDCWISFKRKADFSRINISLYIKIRWYLWEQRYHPLVKLRSIQ